MSDQYVIRFPGLQPLDERELREALPATDLTFEQPQVEERPGTRHEPFTVVAVIVLTGAAIRGIAAWLLKKRHRRRIELTVEVRRPDGTTERRTAVFEMSESSSQEEIVRAIGDQFQLDAKVIAQALAMSGQ